MKRETIAAIVVGAGAVALFTILLGSGKLNQTAYATLLSVSAVTSLAIAFNERLKVLKLANLKVVLRKIDKANEDVKKLEKRVAEMYGNIDHLKDGNVKAEVVMPKFDGMATQTATMNYVQGCVTRERERLAKILVNEKTPEELSKAIMDGSLDDRVFQWAPAGRTLDMPPKSPDR